MLGGCADRRAADKPAAAVPGSIKGDVYLMMQSGDTKRGAGQTVYLVQDSDSLRAEIGRLCTKHAARLKARLDTLEANPQRWLKVPMTNAEVDALDAGNANIKARGLIDDAATIDAINRAIVRRALDTTGSGMNAHYEFPRVPPGGYLLLAPWDIAEHRYRFAVPVTVAAE
jgi:hypothetical protein